MSVHYQDDAVTVHHGDCLDVLRELPAQSVDSVVTDPPYGLNFMGKAWDAAFITETTRKRRAYAGHPEAGPNGGYRSAASEAGRYDETTTGNRAFGRWVTAWASECLRVLKPGGHLVAFGGTRTWHRLTTGIEDAGFDIRDSMAWLYGSGFPKSRDVTEGMHRFLSGEGSATATATDPGIYQVTGYLKAARDAAGWSNRRIDELFGTNGMAGHWTSQASQPAVPSVRQWATLKAELGTLGDDVDELVERFAATERPEDWGTRERETFLDTLHKDRGYESAGGWGTALKPALEPIVVARKPPAGSTTETVATYGTGALNIDGCRTAASDEDRAAINAKHAGMDADTYQRKPGSSLNLSVNPMPLKAAKAHDGGRWPTNLVIDGFAGQEIDRQAPGERPARFFPTFRYEPKAPTSERPVVDGVSHPTVKPLDLMRWLVRLVTPPGGTVLEPFAGSGTTVEAAILEGFDCVAVEREADYLPLIVSRLSKPLTPALDLGDLGGGGLW